MGKQSIITAIMAGLLSTTALAAPLIARNQSYNGTATWDNSTSISTPTPVSVPSTDNVGFRAPEPIATLLPAVTSQYNGRTGAVTFNTALGYVSRSTSNNGADISTLVTFTLDASFAPNTCQLVFDLVNPSSSSSGSNSVELFTALAPATATTTTWPNGNLRDQDLGALQLVAGGRATWEAGSGTGATAQGYFPCSAIAGKLYGGEVVPRGDNVEVMWPAGMDGVKILVW